MKTILAAICVTLLAGAAAYAQQPKQKTQGGGADANASSCCRNFGGSWDASTQPGRCVGLSRTTRQQFNRCAGRL